MITISAPNIANPIIIIIDLWEISSILRKIYKRTRKPIGTTNKNPNKINTSLIFSIYYPLHYALKLFITSSI